MAEPPLGTGPESTPDEEPTEARLLFDAAADAAERTEASLDLEALVRAHPQHAEAFRAMHAEWSEFMAFAGLVRGEFAAEEKVGPAPDESAEKRLDSLRRRAEAPPRYVPKGELGRGGMGVVLRVRDDELRRDLAMKVLHTRKVGSSASSAELHRFLDEAQITGQLEHPGIVPVHRVGVTQDGQPFFTMARVRGRDLGEIFRLARERREGWTPTRVVGVLLKVCETLAYSHSREVLHRDLKPTNVMVGRFGETYVMDWGLAKVMGEVDHAADSLASGVVDAGGEEGSSSLDRTMHGAVIGTPSYMAPEQAEGRVRDLDARADVYSVGAMLYELWAGQPPYVAPGQDRAASAILQRLRAGPPAPLHDLAPEVPPELQAICEKAMSRDRAERYGDMLAMADELRAWLENRVVRTYETGAIAEFRKWFARNRSVAALAVSALFVAVVSLAALAVGQWKARSELSDRADELEAAWRQAEASKQRAAEQAAAAERVTQWLVQMFRRAQPERAQGSVLTARELIDESANDLDPADFAEPETYSMLSAALGEMYLRVGVPEEAERLLLAALEVDGRHGLELDEGPLHTALLLAQLHASLQRDEEAERWYRIVEDRLERREEPVPGLQFMLLADRGAMDLQRQQNETAAAKLREALEFAERHPDLDAENVVTVKNNLAVILQRWQQLDEAQVLFEEVLDFRREHNGADHPRTHIALANLARVAMDQGRIEEAVALYEQALAGRRKVYGEDHDQTILAAQALSVAYSYLGRMQESYDMVEACYQRCLRSRDAHDPMLLDLRRSLASISSSTGRVTQARELAEEDVQVRRELYPDKDPRLIRSLRILSQACRQAGDVARALEVGQEAIHVQRARGDREAGILVDLLLAQGELYRQDGELGKAELLLEEALQRCEQDLAEGNAKVVEVLTATAFLREDQEEIGESEMAFEDAIDRAREHLPPHHTIRLRAIHGFAAALERWEFYDEALELVDELLQALPEADSRRATYLAMKQRIERLL